MLVCRRETVQRVAKEKLVSVEEPALDERRSKSSVLDGVLQLLS